MSSIESLSIPPATSVNPLADHSCLPGQGKNLGHLKQLLDNSLQQEALNMKNRADAATYSASSVHIDISFEYSATVIQDQVQKSVNSKFNFTLDATFLQAQAGAGEGVDPFSPENVANRIMNFVEGIFNRFTEQEGFSGKSGEEVKQEINKFMKIAEQAIKEGFQEAKAILGAFETPPGKDTMNKAQETFDLVLGKLEGLSQKLLGEGKPEAIKNVSGNEIQAQQFNFHAEISYERSVTVVQDEVARSINTKFHASLDVSMMTAQTNDLSPEGVAGRIAGFVEKVFDRYMAGKDLTGKTDSDIKAQIDEFMKMAQDAVEEGFRQAKAIIGGFETLPEDEIPVKVDTMESNVLEHFKALYNTLLEKLNQYPREENTGIFREASFRLELSAEHSTAVLQDNVSQSFSKHFGFSMEASFQQNLKEDTNVSPEQMSNRFMEFVNQAFDQFAKNENIAKENNSEKEKYVSGFISTSERASKEAFEQTKAVLGRSKKAHGSPVLKAIEDTHEKVSHEFAGLGAVLKDRMKEQNDNPDKALGHDKESHSKIKEED